MAARRQVRPTTSPQSLATAVQTVDVAGKPAQKLYRLEEARRWLQTEAAIFNREVGKIFRDTGIALQPCPVLSLNPRKQITLCNQHPDTERIRALCRRDEILHQRFIGLAETAMLVREAQEYLDYARRYEALAHDLNAQRKLVRDNTARRRRLVFQFAVGIDGPALFFTEGYLNWQGG